MPRHLGDPSWRPREIAVVGKPIDAVRQRANSPILPSLLCTKPWVTLEDHTGRIANFNTAWLAIYGRLALTVDGSNKRV